MVSFVVPSVVAGGRKLWYPVARRRGSVLLMKFRTCVDPEDFVINPFLPSIESFQPMGMTELVEAKALVQKGRYGLAIEPLSRVSEIFSSYMQQKDADIPVHVRQPLLQVEMLRGFCLFHKHYYLTQFCQLANSINAVSGGSGGGVGGGGSSTEAVVPVPPELLEHCSAIRALRPKRLTAAMLEKDLTTSPSLDFSFLLWSAWSDIKLAGLHLGAPSSSSESDSLLPEPLRQQSSPRASAVALLDVLLNPRQARFPLSPPLPSPSPPSYEFVSGLQVLATASLRLPWWASTYPTTHESSDKEQLFRELLRELNGALEALEREQGEGSFTPEQPPAALLASVTEDSSKTLSPLWWSWDLYSSLLAQKGRVHLAIATATATATAKPARPKGDRPPDSHVEAVSALTKALAMHRVLEPIRRHNHKAEALLLRLYQLYAELGMYLQASGLLNGLLQCLTQLYGKSSPAVRCLLQAHERFLRKLGTEDHLREAASVAEQIRQMK